MRSVPDAPGTVAEIERSLSELEHDTTDLWRETLGAGDLETATRLVHLSRALRTAKLVLRGEPLLGLTPVRIAAAGRRP